MEVNKKTAAEFSKKFGTGRLPDAGKIVTCSNGKYRIQIVNLNGRFIVNIY